MYWPQATVFAAGRSARALKQNAGKPDSQARIVSQIQSSGDRHIGYPTVPLARAPPDFVEP